MASNGGESFLTDDQREVMKIAAENANGQSSSARLTSSVVQDNGPRPVGVRPAVKGNPGVRHVRRSHSGKVVRVKKDGGGGKGTWGKLLDTDAEAHLDRNDPNYDSDEEPYELVGATVSNPLEGYKKAVVPIIEEYFSTGDVGQAASDLRELPTDEFHPYFVKKLVSMAMDRHDKEKEMASVLLSSLYADTITSAQISLGFTMLIDSVDDLALDIVDAVDVLALFLARAIVDDILPPAFLASAREKLSGSAQGLEVIQTAEKSYLSAPHHAEVVESRWGGTTHLTVSKAKKNISELLKEFLKNSDTVGACRCIRQLGVPFFHHEVVKQALVLALENPSSEPFILKLLKESAEEMVISSSQMAKGFARLSETLDDLSLDIPGARASFQALVSRVTAEGWLEPSEEEKLRRYKEQVAVIVDEYFLSGDVAEVARSLEELAAPERNPIFVKKLITLAMDRKNREKEMASALLAALHGEALSTEDVAGGFSMLLDAAEDTALDVVDAANKLALFLARAVIDEVLAPHNLEELSGGGETVPSARAMVAAGHAGERLLRCWGGSTGRAVEDAKDRIEKLLEEYESGGDVGEACRCVRELAMPFFNHEVVKKAVVMAMEKKRDRVLELLRESFGEGLITSNQMAKGFGRVWDGIEDLALDIPDARDKFMGYVEQAKSQGWLPLAFLLPGA
ncbi:MA3 DOMAIN-CONTAINING TRANSLATION REGULATORY FACTOR 3-like [Wolffia australiana]